MNSDDIKFNIKMAIANNRFASWMIGYGLQVVALLAHFLGSYYLFVMCLGKYEKLHEKTVSNRLANSL